jgi:predicted enzyme related to lactoylglutathione lyase
LRCCHPKAQKQFYCDVLGMSVRHNGTIGYSDEEAGLMFVAGTKPYQSSRSDLYWKIAISVPNIELAYRQLIKKGIKLTVPEQLHDIGYLVHFKDQEGYTIELIEHWFKGERPTREYDTKVLGGGPCVNLLTLRTVNIESVDALTHSLGMRPLSIQKLINYGFTLYFYAFTNEQPPSKDLHGIENRTWVYQRPYTVLEVMHYVEKEPKKLSNKTDSGYMFTCVSGIGVEIGDNMLSMRCSC